MLVLRNINRHCGGSEREISYNRESLQEMILRGKKTSKEGKTKNKEGFMWVKYFIYLYNI